MISTFLAMRRHSIAMLALLISSLLFLNSCRKHDNGGFPGKPSSYAAEVLDKWMTMQIRLMRNSTGIPNHGLARHYAYSGVVALESLSPGLSNHSSWTNKWNGLTGLPDSKQNKRYYFPANVNAAMAQINRQMFPNATGIDKAAIDSLEAALNTSFLKTQEPAILTSSSNFGKAVANAVFNWAETDGYKVANNPYTPPTGGGMWVPTAPAFANAATPYWGANRTIVKGSIQGTDVPAPLAYSATAGSPFYQMVKHVYDASQTLTDDQKAMAIFWRDIPGVSSPGHWLSIVQQVVRKQDVSLEKAALAYALTGAVINDGLISCFKVKYQHNLVRPITYIRDIMGHTTWTPHLGTPAHPEYVSAHSNLSAGAAVIMEKLFHNPGSFTDHTYDYLGYAPRTYASFKAIGEEAGLSRLYAGIHYAASIEVGLIQGRKVATNILSGANE